MITDKDLTVQYCILSIMTQTAVSDNHKNKFQYSGPPNSKFREQLLLSTDYWVNNIETIYKASDL